MAKRIVLWLCAVVLVLGGALTAIAGGALMAVFGSDSTVRSGTHALNSTTAALVAPIDDISDTDGVAATVGQPRLRVTVDGSGGPLFIGIGRAADVDRYLAGVATDRVTDLDLTPYRLSTARQAGRPAASPPTSQTFWVASATGATPSNLAWSIADGSYRLVVMNADGRPGVSADASVALRVPRLFGIGIAVLAFGVAVALVGALLAVLAVRSGRRAQLPPAPESGIPNQAPRPDLPTQAPGAPAPPVPDSRP